MVSGIAQATAHGNRPNTSPAGFSLTLIDDEELSAIGSDHIDHTHFSMTRDRSTARGRVHTLVADLLDRNVRISDEKR
jgi:hypothetical protein